MNHFMLIRAKSLLNWYQVRFRLGLPGFTGSFEIKIWYNNDNDQFKETVCQQNWAKLGVETTNRKHSTSSVRVSMHLRVVQLC